MALEISSINSGSNGNCYYIGNQNEAVLIDAGISCREIEKRLIHLNLSIRSIQGLFISHEHTDHISGVETFVNKHRVPVFISERTYHQSGLRISRDLMIPLTPDGVYQVGGLSVHAFSKCHDACDPFSFTVSSATEKIGVFTDIGTVCENLRLHFKQCHAAFLEANYDERMLAEGRYPYFLKRRITGGNGHLSNTQALELCLQHRSPFMTHLVLAHLSKENNCPDLVMNLFKTHLRQTEVIVAPRYQPSALYTIAGGTATTAASYLPAGRQMKLF